MQKKLISPLVPATKPLKTESEFFAKLANICHSMRKVARTEICNNIFPIQNQNRADFLLIRYSKLGYFFISYSSIVFRVQLIGPTGNFRGYPKSTEISCRPYEPLPIYGHFSHFR